MAGGDKTVPIDFHYCNAQWSDSFGRGDNTVQIGCHYWDNILLYNACLRR